MTTNTLLGVSNGFPGSDLTQLASFMNAVGEAPNIVLDYVDQTHSVNSWVSDQDWTISQQKISPYEAAAIPMIGLPMNSTADGFTGDQFFQRIINGTYDSVYNGIFAKWNDAGYKAFDIRPGWEFNGGWYPWAVDSSNVADFENAFAHIATLAHNFSGATIKVDWNPAEGTLGQYALDYQNMYPGDQYVDVISIDTYGVEQGGTADSQPLDTTGYSVTTAAQMAVAHNKPLGFDEVGAGSANTTFPTNVAQAIKNVPGVRVDHFCLWDRTDGGIGGSLYWSDTPASATAWKQTFATVAATGGPIDTTAPTISAIATSPGSGPVLTGGTVTLTMTFSEAVTVAGGTPTLALNDGGTASYVSGSGSYALVFKYTVAAGQSTTDLKLAASNAVALNGANIRDGTGNNAVLTAANGYAPAGMLLINPTPSPDGTTIASASAPPIIDASGNAWTLVQSASNGLQIAVNGAVDPITANVILLETLGGNIVQENTAGNWYSEPGPGGAWTQIAAPALITPSAVTTGIGSDTLVLIMAEDAYKGDAQFTVSVDGKQLAGTFTATASHAAAAGQNFTFKGDWANGAHVIAVNFLNDAYGGTAATDRNLYVNAISYDGNATGQSTAIMGQGPHSFSVTDSTAIPSPDIGCGSDTMVLNVSEDAYLGNAQFTVSIDGRQLGGTFTATASHAAAAGQNFTFKGDFGAGQHAVAVNFLNDAWGGTAATDRNLYVNGITYNGVVTGQSGTLFAKGPMAFVVSGGTTPSVSETGDHGSLIKNLSQTGTYKVGGDTFVLTSGNAASVTLGTGTSVVKFIGASAVALTAGSGQATVTADAGNNKFVAGTGTLDVTGGGGKDAYVFHANSGLLKLEDFSIAKGDTLTVDKALQGSMVQASDGQGGTMLTFGAGATHGVDIHGMATMPTTSVHWA